MEKKKGFTIIEVVLVLGIAGLIFLMFLIALPALQALQRDSAREENIAKIIDRIKKYQTNSRGALPSEKMLNSDGFRNEYLGGNLVDPQGEPYEFTVVACGGTIAEGECSGKAKGLIQELYGDAYDRQQLLMVTQGKCANDDEVGVVATSNTRNFAILQRLERGGVYCMDSR